MVSLFSFSVHQFCLCSLFSFPSNHFYLRRHRSFHKVNNYLSPSPPRLARTSWLYMVHYPAYRSYAGILTIVHGCRWVLLFQGSSPESGLWPLVAAATALLDVRQLTGTLERGRCRFRRGRNWRRSHSRRCAVCHSRYTAALFTYTLGHRLNMEPS
jgi:hypothetical protein